jgi:UDP-N-acetylglucosamine 2-epimerase (non-hydrolysing)
MSIMQNPDSTHQVRKICLVAGTRPEAIKMAPVALAVREDPRFALHLLATGQHREMLLEPLRFFGLEPDDFLNIMKKGQTLDYITAAVLQESGRVFDRIHPDMVLVHGDTTTTFAAALAAFYRGIPLGHVEAGLRSGDLTQPFPEEMNRLLADRICTLWFPPTPGAKANLLAEGCPEERITVTGNTVIDALLAASERVERPETPELARIPQDVPLVLLTAHRRETWGEGLERICRGVLELLRLKEDLWFLIPMHLNPVVRQVFLDRLGGEERVILCDPLHYPDFVWAMKRSSVILSDSGGVQEEAPALSKPVLVMRNVTERPEAVEAGTALLVGTDPEKIVEETRKLLEDQSYYRSFLAKNAKPFGDGSASKKILEALQGYFTLRE